MPSDAEGPAADPGFTWDPSLYAGSAEYYAVGRVAYPDELADRLRQVLSLDASGRLLDVGCGPGSLSLLLAPLFAEVIGVDADADMLAVAGQLAAQAGIGHASWRRLRAEELPAGLPAVDVVTLAQSFHWMDRRKVAETLRSMLVPGGALVHVSALTHEGVPAEAVLPQPQPPRNAIGELVRQYLGDSPRAGQGFRETKPTGGEDAVYRAAGFTGPQRIEVASRIVERSAEQVVASIYSLSSAAPHLFGHRLGAFDTDLRQLLQQANPSGRYCEQMAPITLHIWR